MSSFFLLKDEDEEVAGEDNYLIDVETAASQVRLYQFNIFIGNVCKV